MGQEFYISEDCFRPCEIYLTADGINQLSDEMRKYVNDGGVLYLTKTPENGQAFISISKVSDAIGEFVDSYNIITEIRVRDDVVSGLSDAFREHVENGGKLYMIGEPEGKTVAVSTSKDGDGTVIMAEYRRLSDMIGTDYAEIASVMEECVKTVRNKSAPEGDRKSAALRLRNYLIYCMGLTDLNDLTVIYRNEAKYNSIIGYDAAAVARFVAAMVKKYPVDNILNRYLASRERIYAEIGAIMDDCVRTIRTFRNDPDSKEPKIAARLLRICLDDCLDRPGLNELTNLYRNLYDDNVIGYDAKAVSEFVKKIVAKYSIGKAGK